MCGCPAALVHRHCLDLLRSDGEASRLSHGGANAQSGSGKFTFRPGCCLRILFPFDWFACMLPTCVSSIASWAFGLMMYMIRSPCANAILAVGCCFRLDLSLVTLVLKSALSPHFAFTLFNKTKSGTLFLHFCHTLLSHFATRHTFLHTLVSHFRHT